MNHYVRLNCFRLEPSCDALPYDRERKRIDKLYWFSFQDKSYLRYTSSVDSWEWGITCSNAWTAFVLYAPHPRAWARPSRSMNKRKICRLSKKTTMVEQLSGYTIVIIIGCGALTVILLFIFAKRQIMRFAIRSRRGPHVTVGHNANKVSVVEKRLCLILVANIPIGEEHFINCSIFPIKCSCELRVESFLLPVIFRLVIMTRCQNTYTQCIRTRSPNFLFKFQF